MIESKKGTVVKVGIQKSSNSVPHSGYGAGWGSIDTTVSECPCGKGTYTYVKDNIPGFRERSYQLDCDDCCAKYNFDLRTGKITEK